MTIHEPLKSLGEEVINRISTFGFPSAFPGTFGILLTDKEASLVSLMEDEECHENVDIEDSIFEIIDYKQVEMYFYIKLEI
jgi:hypothetical protein